MCCSVLVKCLLIWSVSSLASRLGNSSRIFAIIWFSICPVICTHNHMIDYSSIYQRKQDDINQLRASLSQSAALFQLLNLPCPSAPPCLCSLSLPFSIPFHSFPYRPPFTQLELGALYYMFAKCSWWQHFTFWSAVQKVKKTQFHSTSLISVFAS